MGDRVLNLAVLKNASEQSSNKSGRSEGQGFGTYDRPSSSWTVKFYENLIYVLGPFTWTISATSSDKNSNLYVISFLRSPWMRVEEPLT